MTNGIDMEDICDDCVYLLNKINLIKIKTFRNIDLLKILFFYATVLDNFKKKLMNTSIIVNIIYQGYKKRIEYQ